MKRLFVAALFSLPVFIMAQPVTVSVTENINGRADAEVMQAVRIKAQWKAIDRLPIIISGKEQLIDGEFSQEIKALTAGEADVTILTETWDRAKGVLAVDAEVSLNSTKSLEMIAEIKESLEARMKLREVYNKLDDLTARPMIENRAITATEDQVAKVLASFLIRDSLEDSARATERLIAKVGAHLYNGVLASFIAETKITILNIDDTKVNVQVNHNKPWEGVLRAFKREYRDSPEVLALWSKISPELPVPCVLTPFYSSETNEWRYIAKRFESTFGSLGNPDISVNHFIVRFNHYNDNSLLQRKDTLVKIQPCVTALVYEAARE